ncbi:hypothetical protein Mal52_20860 [Symmachiella dynata]|uniref:Uncharacterized protein n=1 Tax=Symmachiella dynata TaxID=2527995 RepID=A0A517ZMA3_9PLAN|nr:hypothetical protein Mal52_20860 [Symmachiella dynata]
MSDSLIKLTEFSLVGGPIDLPDPAYSFDDNWKSEIYTPKEIADAILAVSQVRLVHDAKPAWSAWVARWESGDHHIEFDITDCPFDPDNEIRPGITSYWGGSKFETHCTMLELLNVWRGIQKRCPGVWLHNTDCRMYSPESFQKTFSVVV